MVLGSYQTRERAIPGSPPEIIVTPSARSSESHPLVLSRPALLATSGLIAAVFLSHAAYLNCIAEDAFITFRFAYNLTGGHGIVWNPGEPPVEGSTSFLWLLISCVPFLVGVDVELFSQFVGIAASLLTLFVVYRFARDLFLFSPPLALIPCALLAFSGPFVTWATSGMETNLFGLFIVLGTYYLGRWSARFRPLPLGLCFFTLFLATLTRPEGVMVFGLAFLFATGRALRSRRISWLNVVAVASVYAVPFLIYFAWRYHYFGFLLPNTFYAKTGGGLPQLLRGVKYCTLFALHFVLPLSPVLAIWVWDRKWTRDAKGKLVAALCLTIVTPYVAYIAVVGGDYMAMYRFFVPILPLISLGLAAAVAPLLQKASLYRRVVALGLLGVGVAVAAVQSTPLERRFYRKPQFMHGTHRGVNHERWHVNRNRLIGDYLNSLGQPNSDAIGLWAIGVMAYYAKDLEVRSISALVDPTIAHQAPKGLGSAMAGHEKNNLERVLRAEPRFLLVDSEFHEKPDSPPRFPLLIEAQSLSPSVQKLLCNYKVRAVWMRDDANDEEGYLQYFERIPAQQAPSQ